MKKKLQLVALPTNNGSKLWLNGDGSGWVLQNQEGYNSTRIKGAHHLYLLSDEEIKEGDRAVDLLSKEVFKAGAYKNWPPDLKILINSNNKKIVATTNPDLWEKSEPFFKGMSDVHEIWRNEVTQVGVPKIPHSLIEYFVKKQGKVDSVMVEYYDSKTSEKFKQFAPDDLNIMDKQRAEQLWDKYERGNDLRLTPSGEIIWSPVEEKMYTREQLFEAFSYYAMKGINSQPYDDEELLEAFNKKYPE